MCRGCKCGNKFFFNPRTREKTARRRNRIKKRERIRSDLYKSIKTKEKDIKSECCVSSPISQSVWLNFIARKDKKLQIEKNSAKSR